MLYSEKLMYRILLEQIFNVDESDSLINDDTILEKIDEWLIKFGYKRERKIIDKILYVCKEEPRVPLGDGIDIFIVGKNPLSSLRGKKYVHWFKSDETNISKDEEIEFNSSLFVR